MSKLPPVLLIQLKRFKTIITPKGKIKKIKIKTAIHFEKELTVNETQFKLVSVVNHFGEINKGHYTAYGLVEGEEGGPAEGTWYNFDDEEVKALKNQDDISSPAAYLLFYTKMEGGIEENALEE